METTFSISAISQFLLRLIESAYRIFGLDWKFISSHQLIQGKNSIDLAIGSLGSSGIYLYRIFSDNGLEKQGILMVVKE